MSNEEIKETLTSLVKIREHCNNINCSECSFNTEVDSCMFFNQPWNWDLGNLEERL